MGRIRLGINADTPLSPALSRPCSVANGPSWATPPINDSPLPAASSPSRSTTPQPSPSSAFKLGLDPRGRLQL